MLINDLLDREGAMSIILAIAVGQPISELLRQWQERMALAARSAIRHATTQRRSTPGCAGLRPCFNAIEERSPKVAAELFDTGINMVPAGATTFLQRALTDLVDC